MQNDWITNDYYPPLLRNRHGLLRTWLFSGDLPEKNHKKNLFYFWETFSIRKTCIVSNLTISLVAKLVGEQNYKNVITHRVPALMRNCPLKRKKSLFLWRFERAFRSNLHLRVIPMQNDWITNDYYPPLWRKIVMVFCAHFYQEDLHRE